MALRRTIGRRNVVMTAVIFFICYAIQSLSELWRQLRRGSLPGGDSGKTPLRASATDYDSAQPEQLALRSRVG